MDYGYKEFQRIKDRSYQILAFCLIVTSLVLTVLTASFVGNNENPAILGIPILVILFFVILIAGLALLFYVMANSWSILTEIAKNEIINHKELFKWYSDEHPEKIREALRNTLFIMLNDTDKRNNQFHAKLHVVYRLSVISLSLIFVSLLMLLITQILNHF